MEWMNMKLGVGKLRGNPISRLEEKFFKDPDVRTAYDEHTAVLEAASFIRELRKDAGLTQETLAKRMGVSQAIIGRLEIGDAKRGISIAMLARVAAACHQPLVVQRAPRQRADGAPIAFSLNIARSTAASR
jgi:DNA-binding XRE family transcriptional regulator